MIGAWLTGVFGKIAGSAVGSFYGTYKLVILGGLAALVFGFITYYVYTAERAKGKVQTLEAEIDNIKRDFDGLLVSVDLNEKALQVCRIANAENAVALVRQKQLAQDALTTIKLLQAESAHTVEDIHDDGEKLRGQDTECRTVDAVLPSWFTTGLH